MVIIRDPKKQSTLLSCLFEVKYSYAGIQHLLGATSVLTTEFQHVLRVGYSPP